MGEYIQLLIQINDFYSSMKKWGNISDFYYRLIIRLFRFINEKMGKYIQLLLEMNGFLFLDEKNGEIYPTFTTNQ